MRTPELWPRWPSLCGIALLVWLTLLGVGAAEAKPLPAMQEASAVVPSSLGAGSMPMVSDCMPCVLCCIAPAPATQGFGGEFKESDPPAWWVRTRETPTVAWYADGGSRPCPVPIRISFCRWLD